MSTVDTPSPDIEQPTVSELAKVRELLAAARTESEMWRTVCSHIFNTIEPDGVRIEINSTSPTINSSRFDGRDARDAWGKTCNALALRVQRENRVIARKCDSEGFSNRAAIGVPVNADAETPDGAIVFVVEETDEGVLRGFIEDVEAIIRIVLATITEAQTSPSQPTSQQSGVDAIVRAAAFTSLREYAFAITNGLKSKLGCDEVSLGLVQGNHIRVLCISGLDDEYPRSPGTQLIQQAMEECLDRQENIVCPQANPAEHAAVFALHKQWQQESGSSAVASFPLIASEQCVGIVSVRTSDAQRIGDETVNTVQQLISPLAPGLVLLQQANRSLRDHAVNSVQSRLSALKPNGRTGMVVWMLATMFALWFTCGSMNYEVQVPCHVIAENMTEVAAPFAGRISAAYVEPGDIVTAGQLLLEFDVSDLVAERQKALADYEIAQIQLATAVAEKNVAAAGQANSRSQAARIQAQLAEERIAAARICSDRDAVILEGELMHRVGETVQLGTPLFRLAPENGLAVQLEVDESDAPYVRAAQSGAFVLNARPADEFACKVRRLDPSSRVIEGRNVFPAMAIPAAGETEWLRPGMRGFAKINTGSQKVWWIWLHAAINKTRLMFWSL